MNRLATVGLATLLGLGGGCNPSSEQTLRLSGGGSSLVEPMMIRWAGDYYRATGVQIDYTSSGSGNGVRQMLDKMNDFGCTDTPMNDEQLAAARGRGGDVLHIPLVLGGIVPAYNLPDVSERLCFSGPVLADIFLGNILHWDDSRLRELNPGIALPSLEIAVVHRAEGSGTTYVWADFLAKSSPEWKERVGVGTDVRWPVGIGAQKNDGVAGQVARTPGAIGYVELAFALRGGLAYGSVQNDAGQPILATLDTVTRAAELATVPADLRFPLTKVKGAGAYPISAAVWMVFYAKQPPRKAEGLRDFLIWVLHDGQAQAAEMHYARLGDSLVKKAEARLKLLDY